MDIEFTPFMALFLRYTRDLYFILETFLGGCLFCRQWLKSSRIFTARERRGVLVSISLLIVGSLVSFEVGANELSKTQKRIEADWISIEESLDGARTEAMVRAQELANENLDLSTSQRLEILLSRFQREVESLPYFKHSDGGIQSLTSYVRELEGLDYGAEYSGPIPLVKIQNGNEVLPDRPSLQLARIKEQLKSQAIDPKLVMLLSEYHLDMINALEDYLRHSIQIARDDNRKRELTPYANSSYSKVSMAMKILGMSSLIGALIGLENGQSLDLVRGFFVYGGGIVAALGMIIEKKGASTDKVQKHSIQQAQSQLYERVKDFIEYHRSIGAYYSAISWILREDEEYFHCVDTLLSPRS